MSSLTMSVERFWIASGNEANEQGCEEGTMRFVQFTYRFYNSGAVSGYSTSIMLISLVGCTNLSTRFTNTSWP